MSPAQAQAPEAAAELRSRTLRGMAASSMAQAVRLAVQVGSVVVLSRLLQPADFGLLAMVAPAYGAVVLVQDLGLSQATVQARRITTGQLGNLFWANVVLSIGLAAALAAAAPALARFYGEPRVAGLTEAFAAIVILSGLAAQPQALLNRRMRFRSIAVIDAGSYLAGFAAAIVTAVAVRDYWALFAAPAVGGAVTVAASWAASGWRPGWPRRRQGAAALLRFGGGLAGAGVLDFLARNLDSLLIGRVWGDVALGAYDRAYKLLLFPLEQVGSLSRVMLPTLARLAEQPERYRHAYLRTLQQLLLVSQPGIVFMVAAADLLVPAVLGEQWRAATPIFLWLGLTALQQPMTSAVGWLLVSQGRSRAMLGWGAFNAVTCAAAFAAGLPWGATGVAAAYSITDIVPRLPLYWWLATRRGPVRLADLYRTAWPFLVADAASGLAVWGFLHVVQWTAAVVLMAALALSYGAAGLVLLALPDGRAVLRQSLALARAALQSVIGNRSGPRNAGSRSPLVGRPKGARKMPAESLKDIYTDEMKDLWSANDQMIRAVTAMADKAHDPKLKQMLEATFSGIDKHSTLLQALIKEAGATVSQEHCKGMEGLVKEALKHTVKEAPSDGDLCDVGIISQYQRMSHYGIAGFGTAVAYAEALGMTDHVGKLKSIVSDIYKSDEYASTLGEKLVKLAAQKA